MARSKKKATPRSASGGKTSRKKSPGKKPPREKPASPAHPEPRAFWSGTLTFGLVSVPVDLFPAARSQRVSLRMLGPEGQLLARRYYCAAEERALDYDELVRGYERDDGSFTVVTDEELEALAPRKSRDIDLRRFVQRSEIPPEMLERPYILAPAGESTKAYHLLVETMERSGRARIATFVMRGKEYLAAIFAESGVLHAATMRFADELRTPGDVGLPTVAKPGAAARREIEAALTSLAAEALDESLLTDADAAALRELAERKQAQGRDLVEIEEVPETESPETAEVIDIMSVLRERMARAGDGKRGPARAASAKPGNAGAAKRNAAKKPSRKKTKRGR
jgi:DNA end-binding protein Ku